MKRAAKLWLLAAAALIVLGCLAFAGAMSMNHWDLAALGRPLVNRPEAETVEIGDGFTNIAVRADTADLALEASQDGTCSVVFRVPSGVRTSASVIGGTLYVEAADDRTWYDRFSFFADGSPSVTMYLPREEYAALSVETHTGDVAVPARFSFESILVSVATGDVACGASASGPVQIKTDTGDIRLSQLSAAELALTVSTGRVEADGITCEGAMRLRVSSGKALLKEVRCGSFASEGSTGDLSMEHVAVDGLLSVGRSTGDVTLRRCDAGELKITTSTGDVSGSLRTEKVFLTKTETGRVEVPASTSGGTCEITTKTGDIKLSVG